MAYLVDINEAYDLVKDPIDAIGAQAGRPDLFADILSACQLETAFLFMEEQSFTVVKPESESGKKKLFVWVAYSKVGNAYDTFMPFIEELAQQIDAEEIEFWTALEAMNRYIKRKGWTKKYTIWSKKCSTT